MPRPFYPKIIGFYVILFEVPLTNCTYAPARYLSGVLIKPRGHVSAENVQHFLSVYERKAEDGAKKREK